MIGAARTPIHGVAETDALPSLPYVDVRVGDKLHVTEPTESPKPSETESMSAREAVLEDYYKRQLEIQGLELKVALDKLSLMSVNAELIDDA
mmetsp:Transcript_29667/g.73516  ORF Transcript_29667/g.73516 Transcript_29667/m.73516 type:complete len:92 (-) Transcript_29667:87-362(-)